MLSLVFVLAGLHHRYDLAASVELRLSKCFSSSIDRQSMKTADAIVSTTTGGRHLSLEAFGGILFTDADLVAVPALHLSSASTDSPVGSYAAPFAAHLLYGATTDLVRRAIRFIL